MVGGRVYVVGWPLYVDVWTSGRCGYGDGVKAKEARVMCVDDGDGDGDGGYGMGMGMGMVVMNDYDLR